MALKLVDDSIQKSSQANVISVCSCGHFFDDCIEPPIFTTKVKFGSVMRTILAKDRGGNLNHSIYSNPWLANCGSTSLRNPHFKYNKR